MSSFTPNHRKFAMDCLQRHNEVRSIHSAPPLSYSFELEKTAQEWAETLLTMEALKNSPYSAQGLLGENISSRRSFRGKADIDGRKLVDQWCHDSALYNYATGKGSAGNFTQTVWASTREVGFGKAQDDSRCIVVAQYNPPGNIRGYYTKNVFAPRQVKGASPSTKQSPVPLKEERESNVTEVTDENGVKYLVKKEMIRYLDENGHVVSEKTIETLLDQWNKPVDESRAKLIRRHTSVTFFSFDDIRQFAQDIISIHNPYRDLHGCPPLVYSRTLTEMAEKFCKYLATKDQLESSNYTYKDKKLGENLFSIKAEDNSEWESGDAVVAKWYAESSMYNYNAEPEEDIRKLTGNFTQMIWKSSSQIGACKLTIRDVQANQDRFIVVVFYYPCGNIVGQYERNVPPPEK